MLNLFLAALIIGGFATAACTAAVIFLDHNYYNIQNDALVALFGALALLGFLVAGIGQVTYAVNKNACANYARNTGRDTKFVVLSSWGASWDCFTPASDGHLVPTSQIGDFNK